MVLLTHSLFVQGLAKLECSCLHLNDVNVVFLIYLLPQQGFGRIPSVCISNDVNMVLLILGPVQGLGRSLNVLDLHICETWSC